MIDISLIFALFAVFLLAGVVKGSSGLGLPTTALGLATLFLAPRTAIAVLMLPLLLTNAWQLYRAGISILSFVVINATKFAPHIPSRFDRLAQIIAGVVAGIFGGFTSVWAPPLAIYLTARDVKKEEFVRASGLIFFLGSVPLVLGYIKQGYLTADLSLISAMMLIPTFAGFWIGERLRGKMSEQAFRKLVLFIFFLMGLNLLRRAVFGA